MHIGDIHALFAFIVLLIAAILIAAILIAAISLIAAKSGPEGPPNPPSSGCRGSDQEAAC
jgi:hypothetical protein